MRPISPSRTVEVYPIDQPVYFDRDELYGVNGSAFYDNRERYVFFDRAVLEAIRLMGLPFDVLHCRLAVGAIPARLSEVYGRLPGLEDVGTCSRIHNLAYQELLALGHGR